MTTNRKITIFLASSEELINDRNSFSDLIRSLDNIYEDRGIRIKLQRWEDFFAYCTGNRTQDEYNQVLSASDMCICLFHKRAGQYTVEEFHHAIAEYQRTGDHPKTYVYARALVEGEVEEEELKQFKEELFRQMGHYWCNYATEDAMKLHFIMQFERLLNGEAHLSNQEQNIKVVHGSVMVHGKKIADYANLPFAADNPEIKALKEKIASLDKDIAELRAEEEPPRSMINRKLNERYESQKQLDQLESQLLDMAISISKLISSGDPISIRKRTAIELFEKGNNKGVLEVLNEEDILADHQQAKAELESGRQLVEAGEQIIASAEQKIRSLIDELMLKAKTWMASFSEENRFEEACKCYQQAVDMARESLPKEDVALRLALYGTFLVGNNQQHIAEGVLVEALELYSNLPPTHHPELFKLRATLARLYVQKQCFKEAEELLLSNYELCKQQPDLSSVTFQFGALSQLAQLYQFSRDYEKAKTYRDTAIILGENNIHDDKVRDAMPSIYSSLGFLYGLLQQPIEAILWQEKAVEAYRQLDQNDEGVQGSLASMLSNLAISYRMCANPKALDIYLEALEVFDNLIDKYPECYLPQYLQVLSNMCEFYAACGAHDSSFYDKALEGYQLALEVYRELSIANPKVYYRVLTTTLQSLSSLYTIKEQYDKAEECIIEAEQIVRELEQENPGSNTNILITAIIGKIEFYTMTKQFDKAQTAIVEAEKLCHTSFEDNDMTGRSSLEKVLLVKLYKCVKSNELHASMAIADEGIALCNSMIHLSPAWQNDKKLFLSMINSVGYKFMNGNGVPQNYTEAFNYFLKAAENGDSNSQERLGYLYYMGYGVKKNAAKAAEWWLKAAEQGDAVAQCCLGSRYHNGEGVEQNYAEAFKWFSMAAEQGDAMAQNNVGCCYENGCGVEQNYAEALKWYSMAAEQGLAAGQNNLGDLYCDGIGVEQDYVEAFNWWNKSADQGNAVGQNNVGWCYQEGKGVEQNYAEAFKWYSMAAEQGNAGSQRHLGEMYENGWGVAKSISKAKKYYTLSAKGGNEKAQERLKQMNKSKLVRFIKNIFSRKQQ